MEEKKPESFCISLNKSYFPNLDTKHTENYRRKIIPKIIWQKLALMSFSHTRQECSLIVGTLITNANESQSQH